LRILAVRLRQIGDVVFTTPAIRALRHRFPDAHLSYLVEPAAAAVVALNPHLDEVIVAPRGRGLAGIATDLALIRRLRQDRYDLALDFHGGPRASMLTWLSGARTRIGYEVAGRTWMYTTRVPRPRTLRPRHSVENQWDLLEPLGIAPPDRGSSPVEMPLDPAAAATIAGELESAGVPADAVVIVMHVAADSPFRRWPADAFVETVTSLIDADERRRILITAGPLDADAADRLVQSARSRLAGGRAGRVQRLRTSSIAELRALFERAALYIGGDSGPLHVASTTAVPIVALYGPTLPVRSAPWRRSADRHEAADVAGLSCRPCNQRVCAPGDFRCIRRIAAGQVITAAERLLATR
jgi:ADP-heptose:LPS heptosyltransferase